MDADMKNLDELLKSPNLPRDAKIVALILSSMGISDYEPKVLNQLLELMHRYTTEVLQDSLLYAEHSGRSDLDLEDVRLAIQNKVGFSFTQPPPREVIMDIAQKKNSIPLPIIPAKFGVQLPPEQFCLTAPNFQVEPRPSAASVPPQAPQTTPQSQPQAQPSSAAQPQAQPQPPVQSQPKQPQPQPPATQTQTQPMQIQT
eukprot:TRINITY_DN16561_c0_g1_i1.p1 TRINITY_DN16561_c0_g1~~TRINITY_DN16561_c0_g1_i1.p1  ORF type:complete len:200 (+),score=59.21 TRINITY_DN16561_c0_g1_i1:153-752(+)